ncbi:hypothetical protein J6590_050107 [Homalodisca vitripennis]|nr:hypothetical protein J6590_050107 [Homalodisca vitripennis]
MSIIGRDQGRQTRCSLKRHFLQVCSRTRLTPRQNPLHTNTRHCSSAEVTNQSGGPLPAVPSLDNVVAGPSGGLVTAGTKGKGQRYCPP